MIFCKYVVLFLLDHRQLSTVADGYTCIYLHTYLYIHTYFLLPSFTQHQVSIIPSTLSPTKTASILLTLTLVFFFSTKSLTSFPCTPTIISTTYSFCMVLVFLYGICFHRFLSLYPQCFPLSLVSRTVSPI